MECIQQRFKLIRLIRILKRYKKVDFSSTSFKTITRLIMKRSVIKITTLTLGRINRMYNEFENKFNTRVFLSSYLIYKCPDIVLSKERNNLENKLYNLAKKLIDSLDKLCNKLDVNNMLLSYVYLFNFKNTFNSFNALFEMWKFVDKQGIIEMLATRYDSLKRTLHFIEYKSKFDEQTKIECIELLKEQIKGIEKKAKKIDKKFNIEYFKKYCEISKNVENNYKKAYWDKMSLDIENDNYDGVINNIKDIKKIICSFVPGKRALHNEINSQIDIELIEQYIENGCFTGDVLFKYTTYLFDWLKQLGAKSREQDVQDEWSAIINNADNFEYKDLVPQIFKTLYNIIEVIKVDINLLCQT